MQIIYAKEKKMFTVLAFILSTIGSINWLMIGLFQYDFIAGIFGFQASILSRVFYILFGISCFVLVFKLIKGKGSIAVFSRRNKQDVEKNMAKIQSKLNIEASSESAKPKSQTEHEQDYSDTQTHYDGQDDGYEDLDTPQQDFNRHYRR